MGQIVRRKKKGRPPKADLGTRDAVPEEIELRRSHRLRNVKYLFDLDDYFDDEGIFEDDEDLQRRDKKLKQLLKVESKDVGGGTPPDAEDANLGRLQHSPRHYASSSSDGNEPSKKRKIGGAIGGGNDDFDDGSNINDDVGKVRGRKSEPRAKHLSPGKLTGAVPSGLTLPDKKGLELILDKLQKKDIYGVYSEPVDSEELPGYHDVIKNPMDFTTVRNKLSNGLYSTLDQFESDVFLICSNAMQYNAPDTVYYKQARTIQELGKRKFDKIRLNSYPPEKEIKPEQKMKLGSGLNKQIKSSVSQMVQEPFKSDFLSRATLGTAVGIQYVANALLAAVGSERSTVTNRLVERNSFFNDHNLDKGEESPPGKGVMSRSGRKLSAFDENRRAKYDVSLARPMARSQSVFSTFERESKELVPVGVFSDHSYARSLVRFAATLGPVAWKVASKRIELSLPKEVKFGRGWVGEFEPLPTPVLRLEKCKVKEPAFFSNKHPADDPGKREKIPAISVSLKEIPGTLPYVKNDLSLVGSIKRASIPITLPVKAHLVRESVAEAESSIFLSPGNKRGASDNLINQRQYSQSRNFVESKKSGLKQVELGGPSSFNKNAADFTGHLQISERTEMGVAGPIFTSNNVNFSSSGSMKQPNNKGVALGGLPNGKVRSNEIDSNSVASSSSCLANGVCSYPLEQGRSLGNDPIQLMKTLSEMAQNQQVSSNQSSVDASRLPSPVSSRDSAAAAAARVWMSVGAGGLRPDETNINPFQYQMPSNPLNHPTRDMHSKVSRFQEEFTNVSGMDYGMDNNSLPFNAWVTQGQRPIRVGNNNTQFQYPPMICPPYPNADLSKYQRQSVWKNINPQIHSSQNQELQPPNLSVGLQSPRSPRKPSSGILVDSQQPDLALQL